MSMTDLKAFVETPIIGARKLPAAPALILFVSSSYMLVLGFGRLYMT